MNTGVPLPDGRYDAIVIDAIGPDADVPDPRDAVRLELTLISGEHKGQVLGVAGAGVTADPLDLIGMPATLTVDGGEPSVTIDD